MKKGLKIAGAIAGLAALAALTPYSINKDEEDKTTIYALLWKYTNQPDPATPGDRKVTVDIGFHNPFKEENDELLMDDEDDLILVDAPVEAEAAPQCDIELTLEPKLDDDDVSEPEATPADYEAEPC